MLDWIRQSKSGLAVVAFAGGLFLLLGHLQGCALTDLVSVKTTPEVQKVTGAGPSVTLTEAPLLMEDYLRGGERFAANIDEGYERLGVLQAAVDTSIEVGEASFPGGGAAIALLAGIGGLLMKKPGTDREMSKAKQDSYNKGLRVGQEMSQNAIALAKLAGVNVPDTIKGAS